MTDFDDDAPMTLDEAAEVLLRGLVTASTLRAAIRRRELSYERIGRRIMVTPADITAWRERCRTPAGAHTSSSEPMERRSGTSATVDSGSRLAAARARLKELGRPSKHISGEPRGRR